LAYETLKLANVKSIVNPIPTCEYPLPAIRPVYSVLDNAKIKKQFNYTVPHWKESLEKCLKEF
jgi:dTDP-4-dehydrorhamnose reductase